MKKWLKIMTALLIATMCICICTACNKDDTETGESSKKSSSSRDVSENDNKIKKKTVKKDVWEKATAKRKKQRKTDLKDNKKTSRRLKVVTNAEFPPFEYIEDGEITGAEIDVANAIAEKLGVELEFSNISFDAVIMSVASGEYDFAISGITVTDDRREFVDFSIPYYASSHAIIVGSGSTIRSESDLRGKVVGCERGMPGEMYATDCGYNVNLYNTPTDTMMALLKGEVDAVIMYRDVAKEFMAETGKQAVILDEVIMPEEYAIAVCPGNKELLRQINKAISELKREGRLDEIFEKYNI